MDTRRRPPVSRPPAAAAAQQPSTSTSTGASTSTGREGGLFARGEGAPRVTIEEGGLRLGARLLLGPRRVGAHAHVHRSRRENHHCDDIMTMTTVKKSASWRIWVLRVSCGYGAGYA